MASVLQARNSVGSGVGLALLGFGLFSTHDAAVKTLGGSYSVFQIMFFAVLVSLVPVTIMLLVDKKNDNLIPHHPWLVMARTGTILLSGFSAFYAFTHLPLAEAYALLFVAPLLITALSVPLLGEKVGVRRWAAVFAGLVGVLVVLRPGYTPMNLGHLAALMAAAGGAMSAILVRKIGAEERTAVLVLYPTLAKILVAAVALPFVYIPMPIADLGTVSLMGLLAVSGQTLMIIAYRSAPAGVVAPFQYSQILWAVPYSIILFGETPDAFVWTGTSIIVASGLFILWRENTADVSAENPVLRNPNPRPDVASSPRPRPVRLG